MRFDAFLNDWNATRSQNRWLFPTVCFLALTVLCLTFALMSREEVVVLVPPELTTEMRVASDQADMDYTKAWGLHIATLIGNITPGNGGFIKASIYPLLAPDIHDDVTSIIERQLDQLERDRVALRFEPRRVIQKGARVFISGYGVTSAIGGEEKSRTKRTYEIELEIERHRPVILHMRTYQGDPQTDGHESLAGTMETSS